MRQWYHIVLIVSLRILVILLVRQLCCHNYIIDLISFRLWLYFLYMHMLISTHWPNQFGSSQTTIKAMHAWMMKYGLVL